MDMNPTPGLMHSIEQEKGTTILPMKNVVRMLIIALVLGIVIGGAAGMLKKGQTSKSGSISNSKATQTVGIVDKKTFKDQAEGMLKEGGINDEGSFHLERPGGTSQNVYLTSSTVDLSKYVGKKVRVHGETFAAQTAGWLMDVGLVEILQ